MGYLDNNGLTHLWGKLKSYFVKGNARLFYGTCDTAAATAEKAVTCANFSDSDLIQGAVISVYFTVTNTAAIANLKLNVNGTGAYPIKYIYNGSYSNIPSAGYIKLNQLYQFTFDGSNWIVQMIYNTNSDTSYTLYYAQLTVGTGGLMQYSLFMMLPDGRYSSLVTTAGTGTNKTKNTVGFMPGKILYHYHSTSHAEGVIEGNNCVQESSNGINLTYSGNQGSTLTNHKPVYLKGEIGADGLFYLDDNWITQTLPSSSDGKIYYYLGVAYSTTNICFEAYNPAFAYINGAVREVTPSSILASNVTGTAGTADVYTHIWFSNNSTETIRNYDDDLKYNPSKNSIKLGGAYLTFNSTDNSLDFTFD